MRAAVVDICIPGQERSGAGVGPVEGGGAGRWLLSGPDEELTGWWRSGVRAATVRLIVSNTLHTLSHFPRGPGTIIFVAS
jgi:hypothetical protein